MTNQEEQKRLRRLRIWKYELALDDEQLIEMPAGAQILSYAEMAEDWIKAREITIWAVVDPDQARIQRIIRIVGTGNPLPDPLGKHVGTVRDGEFVWHVFDGGETE